MSQVVEFPDRGVVAAEAAQWLIRLDADESPTTEQLRELREWLHRSPVHREELQSLAALWGRMNVLTELSVPLPGTSRPGRVRDAAAGNKRSPRTGWFLVTAAAAVLAVVSLFLVRHPTPNSLSVTNGLYATAVGQQRTESLADGSQVLLNTNSQINVQFDATERTVLLMQGEALFTVAKNRQWPFRVHAGNQLIEAVGTAFSVHLDGVEVSVAVTEGRVALASVSSGSNVAGAAGAPAGRRPLGTLDAGQAVTINSVGAQGDRGSGDRLAQLKAVAPEKMAERLAWRAGVAMFSGDRLEDVVKELSRYTTLTIEIPDASVRDMRIGGRFPIGDTEAMLAALQTNLNLRVIRVDHDRVVLYAKTE